MASRQCLAAMSSAQVTSRSCRSGLVLDKAASHFCGLLRREEQCSSMSNASRARKEAQAAIMFLGLPSAVDLWVASQRCSRRLSAVLECGAAGSVNVAVRTSAKMVSVQTERSVIAEGEEAER
ncbi:hypothetical protein MRX96_051057 [Rhipicephalus microplus]